MKIVRFPSMFPVFEKEKESILYNVKDFIVF